MDPLERWLATLTDEPATEDIKIKMLSDDDSSDELSREDFAQFLLAQIESDKYLKQSIVVSN